MELTGKWFEQNSLRIDSDLYQTTQGIKQLFSANYRHNNWLAIEILCEQNPSLNTLNSFSL